MTREPDYSPRAEADLRRIIRTSTALFGPMQARRYSEGIREEYLALAEGHVQGRPFVGRRGSGPYLTRRIGVHVVIFRLDRDGGMFVVRILHSRMDLQRHLPGA